MSHWENITRIKAVHRALEELASEVVFVGGATVSLYATRPETKIVHVLNNRSSVWEEMRNAGGPVKKYLIDEFQKLLDQKYIDEWISVHLEYNEQRRVDFILGSISEFIED